MLTGKASGQSLYCLADRLELVVKNAPEEAANLITEFFISKLYSLYHQSTKNARLLQETVTELNMQILKIAVTKLYETISPHCTPS